MIMTLIGTPMFKHEINFETSSRNFKSVSGKSSFDSFKARTYKIIKIKIAVGRFAFKNLKFSDRTRPRNRKSIKQATIIEL